MINIYERIDELLNDKELQNEARVLLLMKMYRLCLVFKPELAEVYWTKLQDLKNRVPSAQTEEFKELAKVRESSGGEKESGLAVEIASMVDNALQKLPEGHEEARALLHKCEDTIRKKFLPFGKEKAWLTLANGWLRLDRREALRLLENVPFEVKKNFIMGVNRKYQLRPVEWDILSSDSSMTRIIAALIDDEQELELNETLLMRTSSWMIQNTKGKSNPEETEIVKDFDKYEKLILRHIGKLPETVLDNAVQEMYAFLTVTPHLTQLWLTRFDLLGRTVKLRVNAGGMNDAALEQTLKNTPSHLKNFIISFYFAIKLKNPDQIDQAYADMSARTEGSYLPEACFLMMLIKLGAGEKAVEIAKSSVNSQKLLPALRKLLLFYNTDGKLVTPEDVAGDQLAEFLAISTVEERVEYLKKITNNGTKELPQGIWCKSDILELSKLFSKTEADFTNVNPMYASIYFKTTDVKDQFANYLRLSGYGACKYGDVDIVLREALIAWAKQAPQTVKDLLRTMWRTAKPDDFAIRNDLLRNNLLERCRNVFCADPEFLVREFIDWFVKELVNKGVSWREGDMIRTIKYPATAPLMQAVFAAVAAGGNYPELRDAIIVLALEKLSLDTKGVELAAQVYGEGKELLDMKPPVKLGLTVLGGWQTGIITNSVRGIIDAMAAAGQDSGAEEPEAEEPEAVGIKLQ